MSNSNVLLCEKCHCSIENTNAGKVLGKPVDGKLGHYDMFLVCVKCAGDTKEKNVVGLDSIQKSYLMYLTKSILSKNLTVIWSQSSIKKYFKWGLTLHPDLFADMTEEDIDEEIFRISA